MYLAQQLDAGELGELLRAGGKCWPDADVVRAVQYGGAGLSDRMRRYADQAARTQNSPRIFDGQLFLPDVDAIASPSTARSGRSFMMNRTPAACVSCARIAARLSNSRSARCLSAIESSRRRPRSVT